MIFDINKISVRSSSVYSRLKKYLDKMQSFKDFSPDMTLRVFVDSQGDFTFFESVEYMIGFNSLAHPLSDTIYSRYQSVTVEYSEFKTIIDAL